MLNWLFAVNPYGYGLTSGRLASLVAVAVGLTSVVIGSLALARAAGRSGSGNGGLIAMVVGLIGTVFGGLHLATFTGGFGTGGGRAGAVVAVVVGLIGTALGALALTRSRRTRQGRPVSEARVTLGP